MKNGTRNYISLTVNGQPHKVSGKHAFLPLSDFLRYEISQTGTKVVCAEGDCGACTAMYRRPIVSDDFRSLNTCIAATMLMDGCDLITVEGLERDGKLCEVQDSMVRNFGGQCGFCTPGFVMSIANMYEHKADPTEQNAKNYLTGNLCRCTGYTPILDAALDVDVNKLTPMREKFDFSKTSQGLKNVDPILIRWEEKEFFAPTSLAMAAEYKKENPDVRIFSGATDLGVQINKGRRLEKKWMSFHLLKELYRLEADEEWVRVGARVSLDQLQTFLEEGGQAPAFAEFLNIFASPQIKNTATLIGNVANGSPIADTTPYLLTADAVVELYSQKGHRAVSLTDFIKGYKDFDLQEGEFITEIRFRVLKEERHLAGLYKVSQRRDLDISCVNASFVFELDGAKVKKSQIAYGGVGPKALRLFEIEKELAGKNIDQALVSQVRKRIAEEITPISDLRGSAEFRTRVGQGLFEKFACEKLLPEVSQ